MNKKTIIICILFILTFTNVVLAVNNYITTNSSEVNIDENLEFAINFNETVITADFSVLFDSDNWEYIKEDTDKIETNYIKENSKIICCYYDKEKKGTDSISLKFKAKKQTNKTKFVVKDITIHTNSEEKKLQNLESENIKIVKTSDENKNNITVNEIKNNIINNTITKNDTLNNTISSNNILDNDISNNLILNSIEKNESTIGNNVIDNTKVTTKLPKAGIGFDFSYIIIVFIILIICFLILKNEKLSKNQKIIILTVIILLGGSIITCKKIWAVESKNKIYINKEDKSILIKLSTSNEERNISVKEFKKEIKAVFVKENDIDISDDALINSNKIAIFSNNEKYNIAIYKDENSNGYVNSGDIFELLNKKEIDTKSIKEIVNFILKKEEFKDGEILNNGYEEFTDKSITTPSTTPLDPATDRYKKIANIDELKNIDAKAGDKYQTLGYYTENDNGNGRYDIIENDDNIKIDNGLYIKLNNGLIAKLLVKNNTVNVRQFGAVGNGKNDDTKIINTAINSGISNIEFPTGEYKITDIIKMNTNSTNIIGNNSVIFTDNDFNPEKVSEFLVSMHSDNCSIKDLKIEARETKNFENLYKTQVYVGATNIKIENCTFKIPETASSEHGYTNIDLYTAWHDVSIENCNLYIGNDAKEGGCIWIRDLFDRGASNVTFTKNTCYKKSHDEILAVFMGSIENVNIINNTFIMDDSTDSSTMAFTFGSKSSKKADNIKFEENTIDVKTTMDLLVSRNAKNLSIKNNNIKYERVTTLTNTFIIYFPENNLENVEIENNKFQIENKTGKAINGLISTDSKNVIFKSNSVSLNTDISEVFTGGIEVDKNNIEFNGKVNILSNRPKEFNNNNITFNKGFGAIAQYHNGNLEWESNIKNNTFINNYDEIGNDEKSIVFMFNGGNLNNHVVNFKENTIKSDNVNYKRNLLCLVNLNDSNPQTIKITNNVMKGYKNSWWNQGQVQHKIIEEGNIN